MKQAVKKTDTKDIELKILHQAAEIISTNLSLPDILKNIIDMAVELTAADSCLIYIYDRQNDNLTLRASKNLHPRIVGSVKLKLGEGITGFVAKTKKPFILTAKAYNNPHFKYFSNLPEDKYEGFLSVPILFRNELVGVINIQHKKPHEYFDWQVNLLFTIAKYLGNTMENAVVYDEFEKKTKQLDMLSEISNTITSDMYIKEILQLIVTMTAQMMNSKICSIMLVDEKKGELFIAATQSLSRDYNSKPNVKVGESVSGIVVKEKKPIKILDVTKEKKYSFQDLAKKEGLVSMVSVPMMVRDKVIGVINTYTSYEHDFTKGEIEILQSIANQSAIAIENTHLNQEILAVKENLETRKIIERAKGLLMNKMNISEEDAYKRIQKKSMDMRKSMKDVSEAIILTNEII